MVVLPVLACLILIVNDAFAFIPVSHSAKKLGKSISTIHKFKPHLVSLHDFPSALLLQPKVVLAVPVMYILMSVNEYITHRYYQHAEFNKNTFLQKITCFVMNIEKAPKVKGGGHGTYLKHQQLLYYLHLYNTFIAVEHHAETYDDMTLKSDEKWKNSPAAKSLDSDEYRGTAFTWKVLGLMTLQMLPTALPVFMTMGFSFIQTMLMLMPSMLLHGLIFYLFSYGFAYLISLLPIAC